MPNLLVVGILVHQQLGFPQTVELAVEVLRLGRFVVEVQARVVVEGLAMELVVA